MGPVEQVVAAQYVGFPEFVVVGVAVVVAVQFAQHVESVVVVVGIVVGPLVAQFAELDEVQSGSRLCL